MPRRRVPPSSLELTPAEMRELTDAAFTRILAFYKALPDAPMTRMDRAKRAARRLAEPLPEEGVSSRRALSILFERALPWGLGTAAPGYLAYVPGGGLYASAVADLVANATNRFVGMWMGAPGLVQLETNVLLWFCALVGYPATSAGILTTGGSLANLGAVVAARVDRLGEDFFRGTIYVSAQVHHSVTKAARVAGFPAANVRTVPVDAAGRMDVTQLRAAVLADRRAGMAPCMVVASAGTTATGAVDPLQAVGEVCDAENLWFHVDAAYGGFFLLTERGRVALTGIERADSVTLDPHKGLFLPYGTGCLLVKNRLTLLAANRVAASYLPTRDGDDDLWDFSDFGPELSRDARGLRVWLPLKLHGAARFREQLDEKLDLARHAATVVAGTPGLVLVTPPALSLFTFRVDCADVAESSRRTRLLMTRINGRQRVMVTGVEVGGQFLLRVCVLSFRTHAREIDYFLADLAAALPEAV